VTTVEKVLKCPECKNVSEVRGFLGMAGTVRNWIRGFAEVTKGKFFWGEEQRLVMVEMKERVSTCKAI